MPEGFAVMPALEVDAEGVDAVFPVIVVGAIAKYIIGLGIWPDTFDVFIGVVIGGAVACCFVAFLS